MNVKIVLNVLGLGVCDASCEMHDVFQSFKTLLRNRIVKN